MPLEVKSIKGEIDKLDFIKIKNICPVKDPLKRIRQAAHWKKGFANHISDKGQISRIYRQLLKLKSPNNPVRKWAKDMNSHFTKEDIYMAEEHMERYLTP